MARLFRSSNRAWAALDPHLPRGRPGKPRVDDRRVVGGILRGLKTGCRWRDAPPGYGPATTVYNRFDRWSQRGVRRRIFERLAAAGEVPDELALGSTHAKAHRSAAGGKGGSGRRRSGARAAAAPRRSTSRPILAEDQSPSR